MNRTVLVSGASIAGPAVAYWLHRYGFDVTVVEKAGALRGGSYPIDIRGTAIEVVRRMGVLAELQAAHVDTQRFTFVDAAGEQIAVLHPGTTSGSVDGDLEVRRGDLAEVLYRLVRDDVEFRFGDSIETLHDDGDGVDVTFTSGLRRRFDLVIGADGLHSRTRALTFGPEEQFHHYLGHCFAGFTVPNRHGMKHEGLIWNEPGRAALIYAPGDADQVHGFLSFSRAEPPFAAFRDPRAQRELVTSLFPEQSSVVPELVAELQTADDLFFDVVSQIHLPSWSTGRVALVGDAAYAPSFLSGQGSSIALVGAYLLAGELARTDDHTAAFAAYQDTARDFVRLNQELATDGNGIVHPGDTRAELDARNDALRALAARPQQQPWQPVVDAATAIDLPDYPALLPSRA